MLRPVPANIFINKRKPGGQPSSSSNTTHGPFSARSTASAASPISSCQLAPLTWRTSPRFSASASHSRRSSYAIWAVILLRSVIDVSWAVVIGRQATAGDEPCHHRDTAHRRFRAVAMLASIGAGLALFQRGAPMATVTMITITRLYDSHDDAVGVVKALRDAGIPEHDITVLMRDNRV